MECIGIILVTLGFGLAILACGVLAIGTAICLIRDWWRD